MGAADVIADWLRTHRNDVPAPAPAEALTLLAGRGAPAELIALYAAVGADVPGLLPPAVPGRPTTLVRPFDLHGNGQDRWTFARAGDGVVTWVGGRVVHAIQGTDTPLADRFDAWLADHLAALVASDGPGALIEVGVSMPLFPPLIAFGRWFVAADGSDRLVVDPRAGTVERRSGHAKRVEMLTTDGRCVVSVDGGGSLRCWWPESGEERSHDAGDTVDPYARPTGDEVYFVRDGSVAAWRPATGDVRTVAPAKDGAVVKRSDGIVIIVPEKARGQKQIVDACPYGAAYWNEERQLPQAWPFDAHLLDRGWKRTRGAQSCPTRAMQVLHVEDEEMQRMVEADRLEVLHPEYGTKPRVYYRNLRRFSTLFIGGSLAAPVGEVVDCVDGAQLTLSRDGKTVASAKSDCYGDFRFSDLDPGSGSYVLSIDDPRFEPQQRQVELRRDSAYLGSIELRPRAGAAGSSRAA